MAAIPPTPKLVKSTALAKTQSILQTLNTLLPTTVTELSPVTVYTPTGAGGSQLFAPTELLPDIGGFYGAWTAPDLNDGQPYQIQVECFGAGGGAGGGNATQGGGGGGGGEYACEPSLTVSPNVSYTWLVGVCGTGGCNNTTVPGAGTAGSQTIFDLAGLTIPGGVIANPGQPGDVNAVGVGGAGGTGSTNSVHFNGGAGGTNQSGIGSDDPMSLAQVSGMFVGNTLSTNIVQCWYILNDGPDNTFEFNDSSEYSHTATVTTSGNGIQILKANAEPQIPAYTAAADPPEFPNATRAGCTSLWNGATNNTYAGYVQCPNFYFQGTKMTVSCWLQCDPTGTWGNNAANAVGTVVANSANYSTFGAFNGHGLFFLNTGTSSAPIWYLYWNIGDNTIANFVRVRMNPVVGTWYYVLCTFNSGTITMYVNGVSVATAALGATTIPAASYNQRIGTDPTGTTNYFFGYISNLWIAKDTATSSLATAAFGVTSPTGGAGGGATGSPGGAGGAGGTATAGTGGAAGALTATPASLQQTRSPGSVGQIGQNAGSGTQGSPGNGAGGGGGGDMPAATAETTMIIPFSSAATYCGFDATNQGSPYSSNQQTTTGVLYTGGVAGDTVSGSKNTMMLLPAGLAKTLGSSKWTIQQMFLTFTNAQPGYATDTILEFAYSADTSLPQNYQGVSAVEYVGNALVPAGSNTVTYDLTNSDLPAQILSGAATALIFGPTDNPTFDAFSATTGAQFFNQFYGVGATDSFGNSLQPFLTVILQKTLTTQVGNTGGVGAIQITSITNQGQPIAFAQPFAGTDDVGNTYNQGFTGNIRTWTPGVFLPSDLETWHKITTFASGVAASGNGYNGFFYRMHPDGFAEAVFDLQLTSIATGTSIIAAGVLPSAYNPTGFNNGVNVGAISMYGTAPSGASACPYIEMGNTGAVVYRWNGAAAASCAILGYIRWWPGASIASGTV